MTARLLALGCALAVSGPAVATAAPGDVDTGFDGDGLAVTDLPNSTREEWRAAFVDAGKIVVAGVSRQFDGFDAPAVVRYTAAGALDPTFGFGGQRLVFAAAADVPDAAPAGGGAVVVAYTTASATAQIGAIRMTSAGVPDTGFSGDGVATAAFTPGPERARAVAVDSTGRVVVAGQAEVGGVPHMAVARFTAAGLPDTGFDGDGLAVFNAPGDEDDARAVLVMPDGTIVVAGGTRMPTATAYGAAGMKMAFARFTDGGALDTAFDALDAIPTDEAVIHDFGSADDEQAEDLVRRNFAGPDRILAVGWAHSDFGRPSGDRVDQLALLQIQPDGSLDTDGDTDPPIHLDGDGKALTDVTALGDGMTGARGRSVASGNSLEILVAGTGQLAGGGTRAVVARYQPMGGIDTTFAGDGLLPVAGDGGSRGDGVAFESAFGAALAGSARDPAVTDPDGLAARITAAGTLDPAFDGDGVRTEDFGEDVGEQALAVTSAADGSLLLTGHTTVDGDSRLTFVRHRPDGSRDGAFGTGGIAMFPQFNTFGLGSVAPEPDGGWLVALQARVEGSPASLARVIRLTAAGELDAGFGNAGIATLPSGINPRAVRRADARIAVLTSSPGDTSRARIHGLTASGGPDAAFGTGGVVDTVSSGVTNLFPNTLVLAPGGELIVALSQSSSPGAVWRLLPDGSADPTFNAGGAVVLPGTGSANRLMAAGVDPFGGLLAVGRSTPGAAWSARGQDTLAAAVSAGLPDAPVAAGVSGDGRVLLTAFSGTEARVSRLGDDGLPDATFGGDGTTVTPTMFALAVGQDATGGGIVAAGRTFLNQFAVTRVLADRAGLSAALEVPGTAAIGSETTATAIVRNAGPQASRFAVADIAAAGGLDLLGTAAAFADACAVTSSSASCRIGPLAAGEQVAIPLRVQSSGEGPRTLTLRAADAVFDPDPADDGAAATIPVPAPPNPPAPAPGPAGGVPAPLPAPRDARAPRVRLRVTRAALRTLRRSGRLRVPVTVDEPAVLTLTLATRPRRGRAATLGRVSQERRPAGTRTLTIRLSRRARRALVRAGGRAGLTGRAVDAAGNVGRASKSVVAR